VGDTVSGEALPVADPCLETVEFYKVSNLKVGFLFPTACSDWQWKSVELLQGMATLNLSCRRPDIFGSYLEELPSRGKT